MRFVWVMWCLPMAAVGAVEVPPPGRDADAVAQHHPDKRRATLRSALKSAPGTDPIEVAPLPAPAPIPLRRQLSEQERADLRQQLRQQGRPGTGPDRKPGAPN